MPDRHGLNSPCPGYLEERYIDGGSGRVSCPWCVTSMVRDGGGNVVHQTKPGRKPWGHCHPGSTPAHLSSEGSAVEYDWAPLVDALRAAAESGSSGGSDE